MHIYDLDTPFAVVDLDVLERNLRRVADYAREHGLAVRPHTKTHKMPQIARRQVELGACGITVAKIGEAEVMADAGLDDIFIAYPLVGEPKLRRLVPLCERVRLRVAVDSLAAAAGISRALAAAGVRADVLVEVDSGSRRCGVAVGPELVELCRRVRDLPGLNFQGVMTYQGHLRGTPEERARLNAEENERLRRLYDTLTAAEIPFPVVSGGSTPNLKYMHLLEGITEIRPGTYVFNDRNVVGTGACALDDVALTVVATVVSTAVPGQAIIDGGAKTFFSDRWIGGEAGGFGVVLDDPGVILARQTEEHGNLDLTHATRPYRVGDRVRLVPNHVCVLVNLHDEVAVHRDGEVAGFWRVAARGRVR